MPNKNIFVLIIRPTYDTHLGNLIDSAQLVIQHLRQSHIDYHDIKHKYITRSIVEKFLRNQKGNIVVIFFGHDSNDHTGKGFKGSPKRYVLDLKNTKLLKGNYIFANSCDCAKNHGYKALQDGAHLYVGYIDLLWFPQKLTKYKTGFQECVNKAFFSFIQKNDRMKIHKEVWDEYGKWIEYWRRRNIFYTVFLDRNRTAFRIATKPYNLRRQYV